MGNRTGGEVGLLILGVIGLVFGILAATAGGLFYFVFSNENTQAWKLFAITGGALALGVVAFVLAKKRMKLFGTIAGIVSLAYSVVFISFLVLAMMAMGAGGGFLH